jgi:uncharacterized membrane protein YbhN (UPF0104 family)
MASGVVVSRRVAVAAAAGVAALACALMFPHTLVPRLEGGLDALAGAQPLLLWLGCASLVASLVSSAAGWRVAIGACGGRIGWCRAAASYGAGSLANSLLPARAGDGVRVALFSRALGIESSGWTASGIFLLLGVVRAPAIVGLLIAATAVGALPFWPVLAPVALVAVAAAVALVTRRTQARSRLSHVLDAFRAFGRSPGACAAAMAWAMASMVARVAGVALIAAALGVHAPVAAALAIVPAIEVAGLLPLTPGNLGLTSGAVAVALRARGIGMDSALSIGFALHAVEMVAGLGFGTASVLYLLGTESPRWRRFAAVAAVSAAIAIAGASAAVAFSGGSPWRKATASRLPPQTHEQAR